MRNLVCIILNDKKVVFTLDITDPKNVVLVNEYSNDVEVEKRVSEVVEDNSVQYFEVK